MSTGRRGGTAMPFRVAEAAALRTALRLNSIANGTSSTSNGDGSVEFYD